MGMVNYNSFNCMVNVVVQVIQIQYRRKKKPIRSVLGAVGTWMQLQLCGECGVATYCVGGSNETLHAVVVNDMRSVTHRPLLLLGDTDTLLERNLPTVYSIWLRATRRHNCLVYRYLAQSNQIVGIERLGAMWEWRIMYLWNYVIIINNTTPQTGSVVRPK